MITVNVVIILIIQLRIYDILIINGYFVLENS